MNLPLFAARITARTESAGTPAHACAHLNSTPARPRPSYLPALDGIRTLAVAAVVLYHLNLPWLQGGLMGVTVFFVLSGYLITRLLLAELDGSGGIDLKGFWIRRIRRLLPAIACVVLVTAVLCATFNHVMLTKMRPDIVPSLLFFNNWWQILRNVSYFDALGDPSPLTHFWSLAIEEQFYLLWPLLLLAAHKLGCTRSWMRRGTFVLAAASAVAMAALYVPGADPSRVYYGTDTRAFSLLMGAWLAFIPAASLRPENIAARVRAHLGRSRADEAQDTAGADTPAPEAASAPEGTPAAAAGTALAYAGGSGRPRPWFDVLGIPCFIALAALMALTSGYSPFPYQGGTALCSALALGVIAACTQPDSPLARALSLPPLVWVGKRSYGIYLWHYPLLLLMNPVSDITVKPWWVHALQILIIVAVAELSYRFIETPCRHGAIGAFAHEALEGWRGTFRAVRHRAPALAILLALVVAAGYGLAITPDTSALSKEGAALLEQGSDASSAKRTARKPAASASKDTPKTIDGFPASAYDIVEIGDSVSVRIVDTFEERFPHGYIDAMKNRQFSAGIDIYRDLVDQNLAGKILVFALGTNGPMSDDQIDTLMDIAGSKRIVVFVNTRSPQPWVGPTNETLERAAERYDNVRVIDWYGYSEGKNELFDGDGTHLNQTGAEAYVDLIHQAVKDVLPVRADDKEVQDSSIERLNQDLESARDTLRKGLSAAFSGTFEPAEEDTQ